MLLTLIKVLPALLSLLSTIIEMAKAAQWRHAGFEEAMVAVLQKTTDDMKAAAAAEQEAQQAHNAHPNDDGGFDQDFRRP